MKQANVMSDLTELEGGHVFRLWLVHDIFRKLHREKQRFEKAAPDNEGRNDQVDAAINFAITAWHMTDWVWERQKDALGKCLDVNCLREFQDKIRQQCPDLAVCDVIANAAKHGGTAHMRKDRPEIETVLIADPVAEGAPGVELYAEVAGPEWSLKIRVNGRPEDPHAVFYRVFGFWHEFIQRHCVAEKSS